MGVEAPSKYGIGQRVPKLGMINKHSQKAFNRKRDLAMAQGSLNLFAQEDIELLHRGIKITDMQNHQAYCLNAYEKQAMVQPDQRMRPQKMHFNQPTLDSIEKIIHTHRSSLA